MDPMPILPSNHVWSFALRVGGFISSISPHYGKEERLAAAVPAIADLIDSLRLLMCVLLKASEKKVDLVGGFARETRLPHCRLGDVR